MMRYILTIAALALTLGAMAQNGMQQTAGGVQYMGFTNKPGNKIKVGDVLTFDIIQKTDKDSILMSSFAAADRPKMQVADPKASNDYVGSNLMQILQLYTANDSLLVKFPADSIFKGHEDQRPAFFPKGSSLNFVIKIEKVQSLDQV